MKTKRNESKEKEAKQWSTGKLKFTKTRWNVFLLGLLLVPTLAPDRTRVGLPLLFPLTLPAPALLHRRLLAPVPVAITPGGERSVSVPAGEKES